MRRAITLVVAFLLIAAQGSGQAASYRQLYAFRGFDGCDGRFPNGLLARNGILYGTTVNGGACGSNGTSLNSGTVFSLNPLIRGGTEELLYSFIDNGDGADPLASLTVGPDGTLYGTVAAGFAGGAVFSLTPPLGADGPWTESVLHIFESSGSGQPKDGLQPVAPLFLKKGVLYGTTDQGGAFSSPTSSGGTAFAVKTSGGPDVIQHSFGGSDTDGQYPVTGLLPFKGGLIGATPYGGDGCPTSCGIVFEVTPPTTLGGLWSESVLYSFTDGTDGSRPFASLVSDQNGILYGTTSDGGISSGCSGSCGGTVFSLTPPAIPGEAWTETTLYTFHGGDGRFPLAGVLIGPRGVLYGTTQEGGLAEDGVVYSLTPPAVSGGQWTETVLHSFLGSTDGQFPEAGLTNINGVLYGTTLEGGIVSNADPSGAGTVFEVKP